MKRKMRTNKHGSISFRRLYTSPMMVLVAVLFLIVATILSYSYISISNQFCQERLNTLDAVSSKLTQNTAVRFETQWDIVTVCSNRISYASKKEKGKRLAELLDDTANMVHYKDARLYLFDDQGIYYGENGITGRWDDQRSLKEEENTRFVTINSLPSETQTESYMTFFLTFDRPLKIDGKTLTHIALARKISSFDKDLSIGNYGKVGSAFVVHANGVRIYHQSNNDIFAKVYNVLYALRDSTFEHGVSLDQVHSNMLSCKSGAAHFNYQGVDYAMAYQYMGMHDWYSVYLVPMDSMSKDTGSFIFRTVVSIATAALSLLAIFFLFTYLSNKRWRLRQEKINRKLQIAVSDATQAKEEADRANQAKSDFLSRMSHDIRTPLNGIIGMTAIARVNILKKERLLNCLDKITSSSDHLLSLVNDVLDMSRIESGKTEIHTEQFNLAKTLEECVHVTEGRLMERPISFVYDFDAVHHHDVIGDETHLKQILLNLLGNSVKFTPDRGEIRFTVTEDDTAQENSLFCFRIQDTGKGMSEEFLQHLFEPFVQESNSARSEYKGTGLGLTIVKELVDLMGGNIQVSSTLNQGSCFTITLGMSTDVEIHEEELQEAENTAYFNDKTIMLVEDNEINMEIVLYMLEDTGLNILTAENGQDALEKFSESAPEEISTILMDVMMPVMDGLEATRQIRALDRSDAKTVPIVAMTANAYTEDIEKSTEAGMNMHLTKPLNRNKLLQTLMEILK